MPEFKNTTYDPVYPNQIMEDNTQVERTPGNDEIIAEARDYNKLNTEIIRLMQYLGVDASGTWSSGQPTVLELIAALDPSGIFSSDNPVTWLEPSGSVLGLNVGVKPGKFYIDAESPYIEVTSQLVSPDFSLPGSGSYYTLLNIDENEVLAWEYGAIAASGSPDRPNTPDDTMPIAMVGPVTTLTTNAFDITEDARPFLNLGGGGGGSLGNIDEFILVFGVDAPQAIFDITFSAANKDSLNVHRNGVLVNKDAFSIVSPTQIEILVTAEEPDIPATLVDETLTFEPRGSGGPIHTVESHSHALEDFGVVIPGAGPSFKSLNSVVELLTRGNDGHLYLGSKMMIIGTPDLQDGFDNIAVPVGPVPQTGDNAREFAPDERNPLASMRDSVQIIQCKVQSGLIYDTVSVKLWDSSIPVPAEVGPAFNVAIPPEFQVDQWDGETIADITYTTKAGGLLERTASWDNTIDPIIVHEQKVNPPYNAGALIYVLRRCKGGIDYLGSLNNDVDGIDLNVGGKQWIEDENA
jgi:hypothetical protein